MNVAEVWIWGQLVGAVAWDEAQQLGKFEYATSFRKTQLELAPLTMPLSGPRRVWSFPALRTKLGGSLETFKGLPGMIADA